MEGLIDDLAAFNEGIETGVQDKESKFSLEQIRDVMENFQANLFSQMKRCFCIQLFD